jgi:cell division protein FtsB
MIQPPQTLVRAVSLRRQLRRRQWLRGALMFTTLVVLVDALVGDSGLRETLRARGEYAHAAARLVVVRTENAGLREHAQRLAADPRTIEAVAREELGVIRPGEMLFVLKPKR